MYAPLWGCTQTASTMAEPVWVFGYGSLIWRVDFCHVDVRPAWISGWQRRFWQGSVDHRGLPNAPGRVVTLVEKEDAICHGLAYRLPANPEQTIADLDHRERGGYDRISLPISTKAGVVEGLTYIAGPDNSNYLGPAHPAHLAKQIAGASGPSGPNIEYLLRLQQSLEDLGHPDKHINDIVEALGND